jgi:hypothetical protein
MTRPCPEIEEQALRRFVARLSKRQFDAWIELGWKMVDGVADDEATVLMFVQCGCVIEGKPRGDTDANPCRLRSSSSRFMEASVDLVLHNRPGDRTVTVRRGASLGACSVRAPPRKWLPRQARSGLDRLPTRSVVIEGKPRGDTDAKARRQIEATGRFCWPVGSSPTASAWPYEQTRSGGRR